ncbi:MAG: hypothetical protein JNJ43_15680 [Anaerolineales bacterium]|nr:hypothetical protein [Anaerolineales bacterium]
MFKKYLDKIITGIVTILGIFGAFSAAMSKWGDKIIALHCGDFARPFFGKNLSNSAYCDLFVGISNVLILTIGFLAIVLFVTILVRSGRLLVNPIILKKKTTFTLQISKEEFVQQLGKFSDSLVLETGYMPVPHILLDWKEMRQGITVVQDVEKADYIKVISKEPFKGLAFEMVKKSQSLVITIISGSYNINRKEYGKLLKWLDSLQE